MILSIVIQCSWSKAYASESPLLTRTGPGSGSDSEPIHKYMEHLMNGSQTGEKDYLAFMWYMKNHLQNMKLEELVLLSRNFKETNLILFLIPVKWH